MANIDFSQTRCRDILGTFHNLGTRRESSGRITEDGLLAEHVLSRHLPRREVARTVSIQSDIDLGWLNATLVGGTSRDISLAVSCRDGWHFMFETRSNRFLDDNVQEGRFEQKSFFRLDTKGRLIARVLTEAAYRMDFQEVTTESSETWFRFEPAPSDE